MTGISEILVLVLLITCILILPRMFKGEKPDPRKTLTIKKLSSKTRIGIVLSIVYPVATALYLRPWNGLLVPFISFGVFPVLLAWSMVWILAGKKK